MADEKVLTYKGRPLMRKDNLIYYGSMADSHIIMLQVLKPKRLTIPTSPPGLLSSFSSPIPPQEAGIAL